MSTNADFLARLVKARRDELGLTQLDVWQADGPSNTTLTKIESGAIKALERATARKLDRALQWKPGSARNAFDGGVEPVAMNAPLSVTELRNAIAAADVSEETRKLMLKALEAGRDPVPSKREA